MRSCAQTRSLLRTVRAKLDTAEKGGTEVGGATECTHAAVCKSLISPRGYRWLRANVFAIHLISLLGDADGGNPMVMAMVMLTITRKSDADDVSDADDNGNGDDYG